MMKATRTMAILMVLMLLALPLGGFAQAEPDAFSLTVDNFQVTLAGAPAVDVGLALNLNAGLSPAGDRGLWVMDLSGADANVLTLIAALENGKLKGYLRNALGGLPYIVEAPMEALTGMAQAFVPMAPAADAGQYSGLLESAQALMEASKDPAYRVELRGKALAALESSFGLTAAGEAQIELFDQTRSVQVFTGETDFAGLWAALPEIFSADPALKRLFDEAVKALEESGAFGPGETFVEQPERLKEDGNELRVAVTEYVAGEDQFRLELAMTALEKGEEMGAITLTLDSDSSADRQAAKLGIATDMPDEQQNAWISLESSSARTAGGEDGCLGLLVESKGAGGGTVAFQIETQRVDATAESAAADRALLSVAFISPDGQESYAASIRYDAENREQDGKPTADGAVTAEILQNGENLMRLSFDILFQRTSLSEGELLAVDDSFAVLDVTAMTEEQSRELTEAAGALLNNTLGLLFQVPGVSALMGGGAQ